MKKRGKSAKAVDMSHFLDFLAKKSKNISRPLMLKDLFSAYKEEAGYPGTVATLRLKLRWDLAVKIPLAANFEDDEKAQMLFATSTSAKEEFLKRLREKATVDVDNLQRITYYKSTKLEFKGKHAKGNFADLSQRRSSSASNQSVAQSPPQLQQINSADLQEEEDEDEIIVIDQTSNPAINYPKMKQIAVKTEFQEPRIDYPPSDGSDTISVINVNAGYSLYCPQPAFYPNVDRSMFTAMGQMMTGVLQMQSQMMKEVLNRGSTSAPPPAAPETTSLRDFLDFVKVYVNTLNSAQMDEARRLIQNLLAVYRNIDKQIPLSKLRMGLATAKTMADMYSIDVADGASATTFFQFLEIYANTPNNSQFVTLCNDLKRKIEDLKGKDKKIPFHHLYNIIKTAVDLVAQ